MKSVGEAGTLGEMQDIQRAPKETLPGGTYGEENGRKSWMLVEHYMALNPKASVASACVATGVARKDYDWARKLLVGGDLSFHDADLIRPEDAIVRRGKRVLAAKGSDGQGA